MEGVVEALTFDEICEFNKILIEASEGGGIYFEASRNLLNPGSLKYWLGSLNAVYFGTTPRLPTVYDKASALAFCIITEHVFIDGNKRTAMFTMLQYMSLHGFEFIGTDKDIVNTSDAVAEHQLDREGLAEWSKSYFKEAQQLRITFIPTPSEETAPESGLDDDPDE